MRQDLKNTHSDLIYHKWIIYMNHRTSVIAQLVKNPPAMQEIPGSIPWSGRSARETIGYLLQYSWASSVVYLVKNPPALQETWVLSLGWEDPTGRRERLPTPVFWPRKLHGLNSPWGHKKSDTTEWLWLWLSLSIWIIKLSSNVAKFELEWKRSICWRYHEYWRSHICRWLRRK